MAEQRVIITRNSDFFKSFIVKKEPYKLIMVKPGNTSKKELPEFFKNDFSKTIFQKQFFKNKFADIIEKIKAADMILLVKED